MSKPLAVKESATTAPTRFGNTLNATLRGLTLAAFVSAVFLTAPFSAGAEATVTVTSEAVPPGAVTSRAVTPGAVSAEAKAILMRMADFMAKAPGFSVGLRSSYDVYQQSGEKIEFSQKRKITVVRPDRLRVEVEESNADRHLVVYDGKQISIASPNQNVYAQTPKPGTVDDAVVYFVRDLKMKLPLAVLLLTTAPEELEKRTQSLAYVEKTDILGVPAHHLAGRTDSVDYQVWVADGEKPLPLRVVLTYRTEEGQPQFRGEFSDWNMAPEASAATFAFTPPPGAQKIAFLAQLPRMGTPEAKPGTTKKSGGKK